MAGGFRGEFCGFFGGGFVVEEVGGGGGVVVEGWEGGGEEGDEEGCGEDIGHGELRGGVCPGVAWFSVGLLESCILCRVVSRGILA